MKFVFLCLLRNAVVTTNVVNIHIKCLRFLIVKVNVHTVTMYVTLCNIFVSYQQNMYASNCLHCRETRNEPHLIYCVAGKRIKCRAAYSSYGALFVFYESFPHF